MAVNHSHHGHKRYVKGSHSHHSSAHPRARARSAHHGEHTSPRPGKGKPNKIHKVMHEFKHGTLHSGSKHGPEVKSRSQAIAIGLSEQRKANKGGYK